MTIQLPIYKNYTIDYRLKEFRKAIPGKCLEFVSFESKQGKRLLTQLNKEAYHVSISR